MLAFNPNMSAGQAYAWGNPAGRSIKSGQLPLLGENAGMSMGTGTGRPGGGLAALGSGATASGWIDPATGRLLKTPTTPQEIAAAETEARNLALKNGAAQEERAINRGTEEITESENEARRQGSQSAAAAGVSNPADMQGGMQRLGSQYAGMRANLARDVRMNREADQRNQDSAFFGRMFQYGQAAKADEDDSMDSMIKKRLFSGGGGGGRRAGAGMGLGGRPKNAADMADVANRSGQGLSLSQLGKTKSGPQGQGFWNKAKAVSKAVMPW